jgi:drug/metabolite transporter (DMT)-like permease
MPIVLLLAVCIALDVGRELCFKKAALAGAGALTPFGWTATGIVIWGVEILIWALVLAHLPLVIAFPIMSLSYALTPLASRYLLGDRVSARRWAGIGFVTFGAAIIGTTGIQ